MLSKRTSAVMCAAMLCVTAAGCFKSKNVVKKVPPAGGGGTVKLDGVPYALPRTVVRVRLPFKRVEKAPGVSQAYAPCFYSPEVAGGRVTAKGVSYSLDPATFTSRGEPDPNEHYIAKIKGGFFENKTMELAFNSEGVITKGDASSENTAIDVAIKAARTVASLAAKGLNPAAAADASKSDAEREDVTAVSAIDICRSQVVTDSAASAASAARAAADAAAAGAATLADEAVAVERAAQAAGTSEKPEVKARIEAAKARAKAADEHAKKAAENAEKAEALIELMRQTIAAADERFGAGVRALNASLKDLKAAQAALQALPDGPQPASAKPDKARAEKQATVATAENKVAQARGLVRDEGSSLVRDIVAYAAQVGGNNVREFVEEAAVNAKLAASSAGEAAKAACEASDGIVSALRLVGQDLCECMCRCTLDADELKNCQKKLPECESRRADCSQQREVLAKAFESGYAGAKRAFEKIEELKGKRENLASGNSAPQGVSAEGLKLMLTELDNTISTYENTFFLGTAAKDDWTADFDFTPGKSVLSAGPYNASQTSPALLLFSKADGLCETAETKQQGVHVKPSFKSDKCKPDRDGNFAKGFDATWLTVSRVPGDEGFLGQMAAANGRDEKSGERGFYYRIPAKAVVKLETGRLTDVLDGRLNQAAINSLDDASARARRWRNTGNDEPPPDTKPLPGGRELARDTVRVAQLGVTASLPASAAGRKTQYTIEFDEATGAMKNFKLASNALLEKTLVDEAGGAVGDLIDANKARDKAKSDKNDELTKKKRELELLQTENSINEEKKKLADSQPAPTPEEEP